jgi:UDP-N-acetylmuramate--alanine ligase
LLFSASDFSEDEAEAVCEIIIPKTTKMSIDIKQINKIYFLGIGGIGMSALAKLFKHEGVDVSGSDTGFADRKGLENAGIDTYEGYDISHITDDIDAVVYTLATTDDNEELLRAKELNLPIFSYAEMLGLVSKDKHTIAICGTHGKTTTTAMIAHMMIQDKLSPSVIVGSLMKYEHDGVVEKTNFIPGESDFLVAESCEYKKSFLNICPQVVCITNVDKDHLDFYGNIDNIIKAFKEFVAKLPPDGVVIADLSDENSKKVVDGCRRTVINSRDFLTDDIKLQIPGLHNRQNASVALALASYLDITPEDAKKSLEAFTGTWRRFEYKGEMKSAAGDIIKVYDDYGHHPHEMLATLNGAREMFPDKKVVIVFEPHLYSRTKEHFDEFVDVLSKFDKIFLSDIYAAREQFDGTISSGLLGDEIKKTNPNVYYKGSYKELEGEIRKNTDSGDVIITMGAGTITEVSDTLVRGVSL